MAPDDEDSEDLYDDEFDFVDDDELDEDEEDADDESDLDANDDDSELDRKPAPREVVAKSESFADDRVERPRDVDIDAEADDERIDDLERPRPEANYVVHIYEHRDFKRTIDRPFIPEEAEAFASEYNRTAKPYGRFAVAGKNDAKPRKMLE